MKTGTGGNRRACSNFRAIYEQLQHSFFFGFFRTEQFSRRYNRRTFRFFDYFLRFIGKLTGITTAGRVLTTAAIQNEKQSGASRISQWLVGPLLWTRHQAGRHFVRSNDPTSDCEMLLVYFRLN